MLSLRVVSELSIVLSSLLFFIYIDTKKLFTNDRIINSSLIHSIISSVWHNIGLLMYPNIIYDFNGTVQEMPQIFLVAPLISFGYSFCDLYVGIKSKKLENIIHGLVFSLTCAGAYKYDVIMCGYLIMQTETSSIFLNLRPLKQMWIDISFIVTFFVFRLIICPYLIIMYTLNPENRGKLIISGGAFIISILNVYWFYYIMKKAIRMYNEERSKYITIDSLTISTCSTSTCSTATDTSTQEKIE
jgi:hypothetical protein